jgi:hypothetical protein
MNGSKLETDNPKDPAPPTVSVVMSVYNGDRFLREAIESVLAQTLSDFELVVVDDGSTDSSSEILAEYAASDSRVVIERQTNQGRARALNRGFVLARGPLVARFDADDVALPNRLESQRQFLVEHETVAAVGGAVIFVDGRGREFGQWQYPLTHAEIREALRYTTPLVHPAVMVRKDAFHRTGGYRPVLPEAEDLDLWLRMAESYELANVPQLVIRYRIHAGQATAQDHELQTLCAVAARLSACRRLEGDPDPLDDADSIDYQTLVAMGATRSEITAALVKNMTWLAKTMSRADNTRASEQLFARAAAEAHSEFGSPLLVAHVHRERAGIYRERGRPVRERLERVRAVLAERSAGSSIANLL